MPSAILQISSGEHTGQTFLLEGPMTIGRDTGSQIRINDPSISRKHATIEQRDGVFYIVDLGSHNGTRLNGLPVTESPLPDSCKLHFGSVLAEFNVISAEASVPATVPAESAEDSDWQSLPPGGVMDDIFRPPGSLDEIDEREARRKAERRKKIFDIAYAAGMVLIVVGGLLIYLSIGRSGGIVQQSIIVSKYSKAAGQYKGERLIPYRGRGKFEGIRILDEGIADVTPDEQYWWLLNVRGKEVGQTKAYLTSATGEVLSILTIIVRGEPEDHQAQRIDLPDEELVRQARQLVKQADILASRNGSPWQALQLYKKAITLCKRVRPVPEIQSQARQKARKLNSLIDRKAEELKRIAHANKSKPPVAVKYLNDILRLIPDPEDKRHQRAKIIIYRDYAEMTRKPLRRR